MRFASVNLDVNLCLRRTSFLGIIIGQNGQNSVVEKQLVAQNKKYKCDTIDNLVVKLLHKVPTFTTRYQIKNTGVVYTYNL